MPKSTTIRMNVRHGEVKMAGDTKNLNANLNHASLFAATIDGDNTKIVASYSPISVQHWNYGDLQVDYSEKVELQEVHNLYLSATSSDVAIDKLSKVAFIKNNFGPLSINPFQINLKRSMFRCITRNWPATCPRLIIQSM